MVFTVPWAILKHNSKQLFSIHPVLGIVWSAIPIINSSVLTVPIWGAADVILILHMRKPGWRFYMTFVRSPSSGMVEPVLAFSGPAPGPSALQPPCPTVVASVLSCPSCLVPGRVTRERLTGATDDLTNDFGFYLPSWGAWEDDLGC